MLKLIININISDQELFIWYIRLVCGWILIFMSKCIRSTFEDRDPFLFSNFLLECGFGWYGSFLPLFLNNKKIVWVIIYLYSFYLHVCMFIIYVLCHRRSEEVIWSPGTGIKRETHVGARMTQILCKSRQSSQPLTHISSPLLSVFGFGFKRFP